MKKIQLCPSLMCADLLNLEAQLAILQTHGFDYLHIDVMDGHFVPNITLGFDLANKISERTAMRKDMHLMMHRPELALRHVKIRTGDLVTFHVECKSNKSLVIQQIKERGGKVGLAISPDSSLRRLQPYLSAIDHVLVMTVQPGFAGQPLAANSHERVAHLMQMIQQRHPHISVGIDGAVSLKEIKSFGALGVQFFVLGTSALFKGTLQEQAATVKAFAEQMI